MVLFTTLLRRNLLTFSIIWERILYLLSTNALLPLKIIDTKKKLLRGLRSDGSLHYITPEKSIDIQHHLGADIIFAFDECTSPTEDYRYQEEALKRTQI